jgi:hypothetical protein
MRLASSALIALFLTTGLAFGSTAVRPECPRVGIVRAVLEKHFPGIRLKHFRGDHARRFVEAYNSNLTSTHWPADEVLIAHDSRTPDRARIGFFREGCLLALVARSKWIVDALERSLAFEQDA